MFSKKVTLNLFLRFCLRDTSDAAVIVLSFSESQLSGAEGVHYPSSFNWSDQHVQCTVKMGFL